MDGPGFECRFFSSPEHPRGVKLATSLDLVSRLMVSGAIPLSAHGPSWRGRGNLYLFNGLHYLCFAATFSYGLGNLYFSCRLCLNPLNAELNPICYLLALLAYHFLHVSRIRVKSVTRRLLMSYIYIYIYIYLYDISSLRVKQQDVSVLSGVCCPELHYL